MEFPIEALGLLGANTRELSSALAQRLDNSILGSFLSVNLPSMAIRTTHFSPVISVNNLGRLACTEDCGDCRLRLVCALGAIPKSTTSCL
jgi:hypothetical protein